jgi:hypothetical protein
MYLKELATELDSLNIADRYNKIDDILQFSKDRNVLDTVHDYLHRQDNNIYLSEIDPDDDIRLPNDDGNYSYYNILRFKTNNQKDELLGILVLSIISHNKNTKIYIKNFDFKNTDGITSIRILLEKIISDVVEGEIIWS